MNKLDYGDDTDAAAADGDRSDGDIWCFWLWDSRHEKFNCWDDFLSGICDECMNMDMFDCDEHTDDDDDDGDDSDICLFRW